MSCHKLKPHDENECTVRVGYDSGARSFYVYVAHPMLVDKGQKVVDGKNGHVILYEGLTGPPIKTIEELERMVAPFAVLTEEVKGYLCEDRQRKETATDRKPAIEVVRGT
jgi:hypothetical protein